MQAPAQRGPVLPAPFLSMPGLVRPEWIDHNGHLNLAYYIVLFDTATDALWNAVGLGDAYRGNTGFGTFAVETHILYKAELLEGDATSARSLVLGADAKRLHIAHELCRLNDGVVAAQQELMFVNVDLSTRRSVPWPDATAGALAEAWRAHQGVSAPDWVGRRIGLRSGGGPGSGGHRAGAAVPAAQKA